jgi:hypothetical protein
MKVTIQNGFYGTSRYPVERITKNFIVVRVNEHTTTKYRRKDGYAASRDTWDRPGINEDELNRLNAIAESNGGTWDSKIEREGK